jgi:hypothetical protein
MRTVRVSNKYDVKIDEEDYEKLSPEKYVWNVQLRRGGQIYRVRANYRKAQMVNGKGHALLHRLIMGVTDPKIIVDHINHDPLDNRKANLRLCTSAENTRNSRNSKSKSGFKGVRPHRKKWEARITHNNKQIYLGAFVTPQAAAEAYDKKAIELFGVFACTNKMLGKFS